MFPELVKYLFLGSQYKHVLPVNLQLTWWEIFFVRLLLTVIGPLLPCVLITRKCLGELEKIIIQNEISQDLNVSMNLLNDLAGFFFQNEFPGKDF